MLVTGGAGYIGSHVVLALRETGRKVVVIDDLSTGHLEALPEDVPFHRATVADPNALGQVLSEHDIGAVMHFAGSLSATASVQAPFDYYENNVAASLALLRGCAAAPDLKFIFSSSAAVYGRASPSPFREDAPTSPANPYGVTKLMTEYMLRDLSVAVAGFRALSLRYFNVAGADPGGRAGQRNTQSASLIDVAVDVALGVRSHLDVFGLDYDTRDGSGERDYIHVSDLAAAHVAALEFMEAGGEAGVVNCGYGRGHTVLEVVDALERLIGAPIATRFRERRAGDIASAVAETSKLRSMFDWRPQHDSLEAILASALAWRGGRI